MKKGQASIVVRGRDKKDLAWGTYRADVYTTSWRRRYMSNTHVDLSECKRIMEKHGYDPVIVFTKVCPHR